VGADSIRKIIKRPINEINKADFIIVVSFIYILERLLFWLI
jgi:hypothetical protein